MHNIKTHSASDICGTYNTTRCHIPEDHNLNILQELSQTFLGTAFIMNVIYLNNTIQTVNTFQLCLSLIFSNIHNKCVNQFYEIIQLALLTEQQLALQY
jgi:hypothetical protein